MIWKLFVLLALSAMPLRGDAEQEITDVVTTLAASLGANNPEAFMKALDKSTPGYDQIQSDVNALVADTLIECSIEIIGNKGTDTAQTADLDWYMVLKSQQDENVFERRRTKVAIKMEKRGKKWVITSFNPASIFAPMKDH